MKLRKSIGKKIEKKLKNVQGAQGIKSLALELLGSEGRSRNIRRYLGWEDWGGYDLPTVETAKTENNFKDRLTFAKEMARRFGKAWKRHLPKIVFTDECPGRCGKAGAW